VTCAEYRDWVAADVDGSLGNEAENVRRHLASCESCRRLRERQVAIRELLRSRALQQPAPRGLRTRVVARLEEESQGLTAPRKWRFRARSAGLALISVVAAAVMILWNRDASFAPLIESYNLASRGALEITFPTSDPVALEAYYRERHAEGFPDHVIDLSPAGFRLIGGVLKAFPEREARLAVYSDGANVIVCDYQFAKSFPFPLPASGEPVFFSRSGVNFCARRIGEEVCLLATRIAIDRFRTLVGQPMAG
jgi:anti-sigma factor (TIGR02949 family)